MKRQQPRNVRYFTYFPRKKVYLVVSLSKKESVHAEIWQTCARLRLSGNYQMIASQEACNPEYQINVLEVAYLHELDQIVTALMQLFIHI